jgi:hypothetical protein
VLSEEELIANAWGLFAGGFDTTAASISGAVVQMLWHPDQLAALRADPSLIPAAVDELFRFAGPVQAQHRIFKRPLQVGTHTVPADSPIVCYLIGSNRDGRWTPEPDTLELGRHGATNHLAFGDGAHKCPGRHLAKLIVETALTALLDRLPGLRLDGEVEWDVENLPAIIPSRVPVAWDVSRVAAGVAQDAGAIV